MNNYQFSGVEKHNGRGRTALSEKDTNFLHELDEILWQRYRQTLPEMLGDLYRQSAISTPDLSVDRIIKELSKISTVHNVMTPLLKKYKREI